MITLICKILICIIHSSSNTLLYVILVVFVANVNTYVKRRAVLAELLLFCFNTCSDVALLDQSETYFFIGKSEIFSNVLKQNCMHLYYGSYSIKVCYQSIFD